MQSGGDRIGGGSGAEVMHAINCGLDHRRHKFSIEFDQERNNGAAGASELVASASAYWLNQAVGAENPHPIAGLRGLQRYPVLLLMLGSKLAVAESRSAVSQGEDRGQQGLLRWALWSNSGIASPSRNRSSECLPQSMS